MTKDNKEGLLFLFIGFVIITSVIVVKFYVSGIQANLYNEKFKSHYTTSEFFFAGETIRSFLNGGEQKTYNVNLGDGRKE